jgi:hypothetical protein
MPASDNPFIGLQSADLTDLQAKWLQVIKDLATTGQSYTFPGRSLTRADLAEARETLMLINQAIRFSNGQGRQIAQARIETQSNF